MISDSPLYAAIIAELQIHISSLQKHMEGVGDEGVALSVSVAGCQDAEPYGDISRLDFAKPTPDLIATVRHTGKEGSYPWLAVEVGIPGTYHNNLCNMERYFTMIHRVRVGLIVIIHEEPHYVSPTLRQFEDVMAGRDYLTGLDERDIAARAQMAFQAQGKSWPLQPLELLGLHWTNALCEVRVESWAGVKTEEGVEMRQRDSVVSTEVTVSSRSVLTMIESLLLR